MLSKTRLLFLIILIEGYVVLAAELLAIRQLVPFVGSGTEIVSIVISAVLLPLAVGYHAGGRAYRTHFARTRRREKHAPSIRRILLKNIVSALGILTLGLSYLFLEFFFGLLGAVGLTNRLLQTALYSALFLVYPVFLLAQTVPLVSGYFSRARLSEITGRMLFFSTAGSFLGSVFSTIVLMSTIGVNNTVIATLALLSVPVLMLTRRRLAYETALAAFALTIALVMNNNAALRSFNIVSNNNYSTVAVYDLPEMHGKLFNINRSASSMITADPAKNFKYWQYIESTFIQPVLRAEPKKDILIVGAGGFTLGMDDEHNNYTFVDIDGSLKNVAEKYFHGKKLPPNKHFVPASARAFMHREPSQYDLIVLNAFTNIISVPMEVTTREFLAETKARLKPGGIVVSNVISSPNFADAFTLRYDNTFAAVFPAYTRQVIGPFNPWQVNDAKQQSNVLYVYYNRPKATDATVYSDDRNTYSLDR